MSHVTTIDAHESFEIPALKQMCENQGWEWLEGQLTYKWFGRHVGDFPLPDGFAVDEMGKCDHAIRVPGAKYEIGVVRKNGQWKLIYDFWDSSLKDKLCGTRNGFARDENAGLLKQAYNKAKAHVACWQKGKIWALSSVENRPGWEKMTINMGW